MIEQAADEPARQIRQTAIAALVSEERVTVLPQRDVGVHAGAVVPEERLRHERDGLPGLPGDVTDDVLELHEIVRRVHKGAETVVDLHLACGAHLVVCALDGEADFLHHLDHVIAQISHLVRRGDREVAALETGLVPQVPALFLAAGVPRRLLGVEVVEAGLRRR